jgi:hypothetical protein
MAGRANFRFIARSIGELQRLIFRGDSDLLRPSPKTVIHFGNSVNDAVPSFRTKLAGRRAPRMQVRVILAVCPGLMILACREVHRVTTLYIRNRPCPVTSILPDEISE